MMAPAPREPDKRNTSLDLQKWVLIAALVAAVAGPATVFGVITHRVNELETGYRQHDAMIRELTRVVILTEERLAWLQRYIVAYQPPPPPARGYREENEEERR